MQFQTINQCFRFGASRFIKDDAFLIIKDGGLEPVSTRDFYRRTRNACLGLHQKGIEKGDRVAILSENRLEWALADYAILCAGAVTVPIYTAASDKHIAYQLKDSGAKALFVSSSEFFTRIEGLRAELPELQFIVTFDASGKENGENILSLEQLETAGLPLWEDKQDLHRQLLEGVKSEDLATLVYTSGTTGEPKGVMLTHGNLASNVQACSQLLDVGPTDSCVSFLPLYHIFGRTVDYVFFHNGVTIAHLGDPKGLVGAIRKVQPSILSTVPRFFEKSIQTIEDHLNSSLMTRLFTGGSLETAKAYGEAVTSGKPVPPSLMKKWKAADKRVFSKIRKNLSSRMRFFISGGAPLSKDIGLIYHGFKLPICEGYGLSETSPVITMNTTECPRYGTAGRPIPGVEVKIAGDGEILTKGPHVMAGYWNKEEATAEAIKDGWFYTGDIGHLDDDGYLHITDRKKNLLVTAGGKNVAPAAVESLAMLSPYVDQVAVIGDREKFIAALVYPHLPAFEKHAIKDPSDSRIRDIILSDLAPRLAELNSYEKIKDLRIIPEPFSVENGTLTATQKVRRPQVLEKYKDLVADMYRH